MDHDRHQDTMDRNEQVQGDRDVVFVSRGAFGTRTEKGPSIMAEGEEVSVKLEHNTLTDVMYVDIQPLFEGSVVSVCEVGDSIGFPGQIQARFDADRGILYGLTIQNFSGFKRRLLWRYRMWSIQRALELLVATLKVGLGMDNHRNDRPALCHH
ncbi:MAG: hypothetical protein P4M01_06525 [Acidobacteriota bacterium]|nr:hypothetical protein [Acidobacteriota bacterium]